MDTVNDAGKTRKFILWVEDFGEQKKKSRASSDPPDPIGDDMPYFGFPDYLRKRIDIIRDPTDLPGKMESEGKNYELIVLDKNFKKECINKGPEEIRDFVESLIKANINCDGFLKDPKKKLKDKDNIKDIGDWGVDVLADLGHYLSSYLLVSQKVPVDQIVFLTGNAEEKNEKGFISIKEYDKYNSMPNDPFTKYIKKKFPESELSPESVLNQAKNLFYRWKTITNGTIPNDSALVRLCYSGSKGLSSEDNKAIIARIEDALYNVNVSNASQAFDMILAAVAFPFGERILNKGKENRDYWDEALCRTMKHIRNPYCHRHGEICVDESDFFVLFVAGMRAIFDSGKDSQELEEETWFKTGLKNSIITNKSDQKYFNQKKYIKNWYFQCLNNLCLHRCYDLLSIADMDTLLERAREIYSISDVVHMLIMKSLTAKISFENKSDYPDIMCTITLEIKVPHESEPESKKIIADYAELYSKNEKDDPQSDEAPYLFL